MSEFSRFPGGANRQILQRIRNGFERWIRGSPRDHYIVIAGRDPDHIRAERFPDKTLPAIANNGITDFARNTQPQSRPSKIISDGVDDKYIVGHTLPSLKDALELGRFE